MAETQEKQVLVEISPADSPADSKPTQTFLELQQQWTQWTYYLLVFTIVYNLAEGGVAVYYGAEDEAVSLFGFGIDSMIEVASSTLVLFHMLVELKKFKQTSGNTDESLSNEEQKSSQLFDLRTERRATLTIGVLLIILAVSAITGGIIRLATHGTPQSTLGGIVVSSASLSFMFFLWYSKTKAAVILDSSTLTSDANCSLGCIKLSCILLLGSVLFEITDVLWWIDAVTAILIGLTVSHEGYSTIKEAMKEDFSGGCGCCSGSDTRLAKYLREKLEANMDMNPSWNNAKDNDSADNSCKDDCCSNKKTAVDDASDHCDKQCCATKTSSPPKKDKCCSDGGCSKAVPKSEENAQLLAEKKSCSGGCCAKKDAVEVVEINPTPVKKACGKKCCGGKKEGTQSEQAIAAVIADDEDELQESAAAVVPKKKCCASGKCSSKKSNEEPADVATTDKESEEVSAVPKKKCGGKCCQTKEAVSVSDDEDAVTTKKACGKKCCGGKKEEKPSEEEAMLSSPAAMDDDDTLESSPMIKKKKCSGKCCKKDTDTIVNADASANNIVSVDDEN